MLLSCNKWLDVKPEDKVLYKQVFATEASIHTALNGIYIQMASRTLYGERLSLTMLEIMAQQYFIPNNFRNQYFLDLSKYDYLGTDLKDNFNNIWKDQYKAILNVNFFIENMELSDVLPADKRDLLLGEAYGLRAFLHFDLLRIFGPVYHRNPDAISIPYYTKAEGVNVDLLKARTVMDFIISDIKKSLELLSNDPIIKEGVMTSSVKDPIIDYYRFRNRRFNYFAAKAMLARVYLYTGTTEGKQEALRLAKEFVTETETVFPFQEASKLKIDRRISEEIVFSIENTKMWDTEYYIFSQSVKSLDGLFPLASNVKKAFGLLPNQDLFVTGDMRVFAWENMHMQSEMTKYLLLTVRNARPKSLDENIHNLQPLIRKTEMYLIIAELENSIEPINKIREARGDTQTIPSGAEVYEEIRREYIREMYGEGQLFFYYKRLGKDFIPDGNSEEDKYIIMNDKTYTVPIPDREFE